MSLATLNFTPDQKTKIETWQAEWMNSHWMWRTVAAATKALKSFKLLHMIAGDAATSTVKE